MLIKEILDKKVDYEVVRAIDSIFHTRAKIGDRVINFSGVEEDDGSWEISFGEKLENGRISYGKTGSGNELGVFSMVKDSILELVSRYHPDVMIFTADKEGSSNEKNTRADVYSRLIQRFKIPGYSCTRRPNVVDGYDTFTIKKN